jgi:hypothetical protein
VSLSLFINRPCSILTRSESGSKDIYGDPDKTPDSVDTVCEMQPRSAVEPENAGDLSDEDWVGWFFPADHASLNSASAVAVPGLGTFEVAGSPAIWHDSITQQDDHIQVNLRRTAGPADS